MRILVEQSAYTFDNLGDIAMLQVGVARLRECWPAAEVGVITRDPAALVAAAPAVTPVVFSGVEARLIKMLPPPLWAGLAPLERLSRPGDPVWRQLQARVRASGYQGPLLHLADALRRADLLVVTGGGFINDTFDWHADLTLSLLNLAHQRGTPAALFGQGLGPLNSSGLRAKAGPALGRAVGIGLREGEEGPQILASLGVGGERVVVTGDDAIELAYGSRAAGLGNAIGVNLRVAAYSGVALGAAAGLRQALADAAARYGAPLIAVPIAIGDTRNHGQMADLEAIGQLLDGVAGYETPAESPQTPRQLIPQAGRCRVVVTGSYHAAVFALAQGVSVVGVFNNEYYRLKFTGLQRLFGAGCVALSFAEAAGGALPGVLDELWEGAPARRGPLLEAAARQIALSRGVYRQVAEAVSRGDRRLLLNESPNT